MSLSCPFCDCYETSIIYLPNLRSAIRCDRCLAQGPIGLTTEESIDLWDSQHMSDVLHDVEEFYKREINDLKSRGE